MEEQKTNETEIHLMDLWAILKSCWWQLLIVLIVVSMVLYIGLNATHEDEYTASLTIYVLALPNDGDDMNSTAALSWATNLINDCEILIKSHDKVLTPVAVEQNLSIEAKDLERMISIKRVSENARVLKLSFTSKNPERSAEIVNALGNRACYYFNEVLYKKAMLSVVDEASVPEVPSNPVSTVMILLIGFVCAAFVYAIHLLRFILDDKINNAEDVEKYLGLSMLGVIPNKNDVGRRKSKYGYYYSYTADGERKRQ
jgi:capsular polysaccharide biosynthesis protein